MTFSFWENKNWFTNIDYIIVGSGIVGLHTALTLREYYPKSKILILEKGILPQGASTKNAGFACFGSLSEILSDLENTSETEVLNLIKKRWKGLQLLRQRLGDAAIDYQNYGGYELFFDSNTDMYKKCLDRINLVNQMLRSVFNSDVFELKNNTLGFKNCKSKLIFNSLEGQIDTGNMMQALLKEAYKNDILILNHQEVLHFEDSGNEVKIQTNHLSLTTKKIFFATN